MSPGPFSPFLYWPHVLLGISSVALVLIAIFSAKGSRLHRKSGKYFSIFMGVAAVTAIYFAAVQGGAPAPIVSAAVALYGIGAAWLTLRKRQGTLLALQHGLVLIPIGLALFALFPIVGAGLEGLDRLLENVPIFLPFVLLFTFIAWGDIQYLRSPQDDRFRQFKRHALRMAVVASEVVRAPLMSFGPDLGAITFPLYFMGPFWIIPLVYFFAMPKWVKNSELGGFRSIHEGPANGSA